MWQILANVLIASIIKEIPKIVETAIEELKTMESPMTYINELLDSDDTDTQVEEALTTRKRNDCSLWTQYQMDFVIDVYHARELYNRGKKRVDRISLDTLVHRLNIKMNLTKSESAYRTLWTGDKDRDSLIPGEAYFDNNVNNL